MAAAAVWQLWRALAALDQALSAAWSVLVPHLERLTRPLNRTITRAWRRVSPPTFFVISFALLIALGTLGLMGLPGLYTGPGLGLVDALFTMTSAVCVTGLIVVDTATYFTIWGQLWVLLFIQLGGLGLITLTSAIIGALGRRLSLRSEMISVGGATLDRDQEIWRLASAVARFTLLVELLGALALFALWVPHFSIGQAAWHALFHSISAFCNAGFSTFSDSLMGFAGSPLVLTVVSVLIILGGFGFLTLEEVQRWLRRSPRERRRLSTNSYAVVVTTIALLALGFVAFFLFEWDGVLAPLPWPDKVSNAWFMSVTARTAGFNAVPYEALSNDGALMTVMLMLVGGSPGSTAGGLKTTTFAVLVALAWSRVRGRRYVELHQRGIPEGTIERTVSLTLLAVLVVTAAFFALDFVFGLHHDLVEQRAAFLPLVFEVVSAFCTVGLSMGVTGDTGDAGALILVVLMFIGRVGLLSFFALIVLRKPPRAARLRLAQEDLVVG